jgi:hypothetical protein
MGKKRGNIYVLEEVWKEFLKICKREGTNASNKLETFMQTYNQEHKAGNPQLLISHYVKDDEFNPNHYFCNYSKGRMQNGKVFCTNSTVIPMYERILVFHQEGNWVPGVTCYSCKSNKLRKNERKWTVM